MKKYLLCLVTFVSFSLFAQTSVYVPFPDSNAVWNQDTSFYNGQSFQTIYYNYFLRGDSTVGALNYIKLYKDYVNNWNVFTGLYRNDAGAKKVYFYQGSGSECLLYDFNLAPGDTLKVKDLCQWGNLFEDSTQFYVVTSIDSLSINGAYRKRFNMTAYSAITPTGGLVNFQWVEGIGDLGTGLMRQINYFEGVNNLHCFFREGVMNYGYAPACVNVMDIQAQDPANLSGYIADNVIHFGTSDLNNAPICLFDVSGRLLMEARITNSNFHLPALSAGCYFYRLVWEGRSYVRKFILN
jgi:hypothetical protein